MSRTFLFTSVCRFRLWDVACTTLLCWLPSMLHWPMGMKKLENKTDLITGYKKASDPETLHLRVTMLLSSYTVTCIKANKTVPYCIIRNNILLIILSRCFSVLILILHCLFTILVTDKNYTGPKYQHIVETKNSSNWTLSSKQLTILATFTYNTFKKTKRVSALEKNRCNSGQKMKVINSVSPSFGNRLHPLPTI